MSDAATQWNELYRKGPSKRYPDEAVIRIFLGSYPRLKMPKPKQGDSILEVGFGDGRNFNMLDELGEFKLAGAEITEEIIKRAKRHMGMHVDLRVGTCASLPWPDATFDYLLTWNSCYYMGPDGKFEDHVAEMARVLKPGGWIVCSVPTPYCFIFKDAEDHDDGYVTIRNDHFGLRNGERMRRFRDRLDLVESFSSSFGDFCHARIDIDMFGLAYDWHVFTAERRS